MKQLEPDQFEKYAELFERLVGVLPDHRRSLVKDMLDTQVGESFMTSPASSRAEFHGCFPGGLLVHSVGVVDNLRKISSALCPKRFSDETLVFVGLFHDLGKTGDGEEPFYVPNTSDWHVKKGMLYEINKDCRYMPTSERGLYILQKNGIELSAEEYLAIRLNDGMYTDENKGYSMKEPPLSLLLHWADRWSVEIEKESEK